jgi:MFS family permease
MFNLCKREQNLDKVSILSVGFLFLFTAYNAAANLSAQALENNGFEGLGYYTMATLYLVFGFCAFTSSFIVKKLGAKASLFWGATCYSFWILCFLPPSYYPENKDSGSFLFNRTFIIVLTFFSAAVDGFGAGILWVAQGNYISECATDDNKGFFFGLF